MGDRSSLDDVGIEVAKAWAKRGTCIRRQVGCLLVDERGHTLATGYNGPASGEEHCIVQPCPGASYPSGQGLSKCEAIHAEANALIRCRFPELIHTCYCTSAPCIDCVKLLMSTSCRRIVFLQDYPHAEEARRLWTKRQHREWIQHG